ncbi:MAG: hypothetical protein PHV37_05820 [Candidatus Gastranaerophilales bacterium]|nr:hypothetical protein [Candidatus Gastranaerophilales bacterium]
MKIGLNEHLAFRGKQGMVGSNTTQVQYGAQPIRENLQGINTTASEMRNATSGRLSFKGASSTLNKGASEFAQNMGEKLAYSKSAQKLLTWVNNNKMLSEAIFAVALTCVLRPLTIMITPSKDEENKQKNRYAAAKSVSSGLIGLGATFLISQPFKSGTDVAKKQLKANNQIIDGDYIPSYAEYLAKSKLSKTAPETLKEELITNVRTAFKKSTISKLEDAGQAIVEDEIMKKAPTTETIDTLLKKAKDLVSDKDLDKMLDKIQHPKKVAEAAADGAKDVTKQLTKTLEKRLCNYESTVGGVLERVHSPVFLPLRAMATIALVPIILGALGIKKSPSKPKEAVTTASNQPPAQSAQQAAPIQNAATPLPPNMEVKQVFQSFAGVTK